MSHTNHDFSPLKKAVFIVAVLNFLYFFIEFSVAFNISSLSLMADSIDFLEDAFVNGLIVLALGWTLARQARVGMILAAIMLIPSAYALYFAFDKILHPALPASITLTMTGAAALIINLFCAYIIARSKNTQSSLGLAAFLSARNDAIANIAIIGAGFATAATLSQWPDFIVGIGIFLMNLDAAFAVYKASREESYLSKEVI
ncbi:cation transporter [Sulfuricurvum sp.]|uniref:cation transporter n=1 Tax=Sulfuricurvum sp. TaxID=2025608 RepID=UPI002602B71F|nr:cation transporter [Sulfuricurvum sp.]MDD2781522.1 cation transporter [Sulfuricurvum sp.]